MDNINTVLEAMKKANEPVNASKIVALTGLDKKDVDKAMNQLKKDNKIESPKRCFWQPK